MGHTERETGGRVSSFEVDGEVDMQDVHDTFWLEFEPLQDDNGVMGYWHNKFEVEPPESTLMRWDEYGNPVEISPSKSEKFWNDIIKMVIADGRSTDKVIASEPVIQIAFNQWLAYNSHRWEV